MQNLYPLFERNRILKKELLLSLRDYSFAHIQLEYQEYSQGILQGCDITVQGDQLIVGTGIIKYREFICLLNKEERIPYQPSEQVQYLKVSIAVDYESPDYIAYRIVFVLDHTIPKNDEEFELCRFNLRTGAQLRTQYKDFLDMETEYDTVNLIYADWSGLRGKAMAPAITKYFAQIILASENCLPEDQFFAYMCLNQSKPVANAVLTDYLNRKTQCGYKQLISNREKFGAMITIIGVERDDGKKKVENVKERRQILLD